MRVTRAYSGIQVRTHYTSLFIRRKHQYVR